MRLFHREKLQGAYDNLNKEFINHDVIVLSDDKPSCFYYYGYPKSVTFCGDKPQIDTPSAFLQEFLKEGDE